MLNLYLSNTALLLQNPAAPSSLYSTANLSTFINTARTQLAGQTECVRSIGSLTVVPGTQLYNFSAITGLPSTSIQGVYNVRQATYISGSGQIYMGSRPYPWAELYWNNNPSPITGTPSEWSQYGQGVTGSLLVNPPLSGTFTLLLDCSCYPILLASDLTPEAIPYPWTDAVPFLAAFYAYLSAQRQSDADKMLQRYEDFVGRGKTISVPHVLPEQYDQHQMMPQNSTAGEGGGP